MPKKVATPTIDRLLDKCVELPSGCWDFRGAKVNGYGQIRDVYGGATVLAHRYAYEFFRAPIPAGLVLDHLCRRPSCCNPWHAEPVTDRVNILRGVGPLTAGAWRAEYESAKTECPYGHAYDGDNTYVTSYGHRQCRACKARRQAEYRDRKKATT